MIYNTDRECFLGVVMDPSSYFNKYISNINDDVNVLYRCTKPEEGFIAVGDGESRSVEVGEDKLEKLQSIFKRTKLISKHLEDLEWCVTVLDREAEDKTLVSAFYTLNKLQEGMLDTELSLRKIIDSESSEEEADLAKLNLEMLKDIRKGSLEKAVNTTHEKLHKSARATELLQEAPLVPKQTTAASSQPNRGGILRSMYGATGAALGMVGGLASKVYGSKPITFYYESTDKDVPERKADIISMIKGEKMITRPTKFINDEGMVADKYGEYIEAPSIFTADLHRCRSFHFNQKPLFETGKSTEYNTNEVARALYRRFGKEGANRIMQICNQAIMPFILENKVFPLVIGKWGNLLSDKGINPSQAPIKDGGGFVIDVMHNEQENKVTLSVKLLMQLHYPQEAEFSAHFVSKTLIEIPFDELTRENLDEESLKANLHVEDTLTKLFIDNLAEARSVSEKL